MVMVQERNVQPRKIQDGDSVRNLSELRESNPAIRTPAREPRRTSSNLAVPPANNRNGGLTDALTGLGLLLSTIAFFFSAYAVVQAVAARRAIQTGTPSSVLPRSATQSGQQATGGGTVRNTDGISRPAFPFLAPSRFERVSPGQFVQPFGNGAGEIELLSATRVNNSPNSNVVNIQMRIRRLSQQLNNVADVDLARSIVLNSRTNERYPVLRQNTPGEDAISLYSLRPNQSINASISVRVPADLQRIDLEIPDTRVFRNVPIALS